MELKEKDGRRLGDLCRFLGETWELYKLGPEYYHVRKLTNHNHTHDTEFHTNYNDCWTDADCAIGGLQWINLQRVKGQKRIKSWSIK